jgi:aryl-alcohol dehydrogenase-like predicted oxidoreductase
MEYSLLDRRIELNGVLAAAKELGITITAYTPLGYGLLTGKYHKNPDRIEQASPIRRRMLKRDLEPTHPLVEALEEIGKNYDAMPGQVALNWIIHFQGETVVTIPGATKTYQVEQSAGAMKFKLSEAELTRLDELSKELI